MASTELPTRPRGEESVGFGDVLSLLPVDKLDPYDNCYPDLNPLDVYRSHLASILAEATGVDAKIVYGTLQWTQTLDKGDLVLAVPALRVKGKKPGDLAQEIVEKVCPLPALLLLAAR
jgi:arginyl-tRNA synthetase